MKIKPINGFVVANDIPQDTYPTLYYGKYAVVVGVSETVNNIKEGDIIIYLSCDTNYVDDG